MCKWNTLKKVKLTNGQFVSVDSCIADIIQALNNTGIRTVASCCGHGKQPSSIILADGKEIRIFPDWESARKVDKLFPPIN